jgi:hypothetical protein
VLWLRLLEARDGGLGGLGAGFREGVMVLLVTVFAMARTSSRLKAMGLEAALRFRMLSRRAVFLDGFSMGGELFAGLPLGAALTAAGRAGAG